MQVNEISDSYTGDGLVSATEIREGCVPCAACAAAGETHRAGPGAVRRTAFICVPFRTFETLVVW